MRRGVRSRQQRERQRDHDRQRRAGNRHRERVGERLEPIGPAAKIRRNHFAEQLRESRPAFDQALSVEEAVVHSAAMQTSAIVARQAAGSGGVPFVGEDRGVTGGGRGHPLIFDRSSSRIFAVSRSTS